MIAPELLEILRCPETRQRLRVASDDEVRALNAAIRTRQVQKQNHLAAINEVEGALVREDGLFAYPIRNRLPILLVDEALSLRFGVAAQVG